MTALVTGGIGRAVVEELAALGTSVHTCSRDEAELRAPASRSGTPPPPAPAAP
jgi:NAD(P)-dependent dehydrogenase (short-subunit alcohol dehydrogenase family)